MSAGTVPTTRLGFERSSSETSVGSKEVSSREINSLVIGILGQQLTSYALTVARDRLHESGAYGSDYGLWAWCTAQMAVPDQLARNGNIQEDGMDVRLTRLLGGNLAAVGDTRMSSIQARVASIVLPNRFVQNGPEVTNTSTQAECKTTTHYFEDLTRTGRSQLSRSMRSLGRYPPAVITEIRMRTTGSTLLPSEESGKLSEPENAARLVSDGRLSRVELYNDGNSVVIPNPDLPIHTLPSMIDGACRPPLRWLASYWLRANSRSVWQTLKNSVPDESGAESQPLFVEGKPGLIDFRNNDAIRRILQTSWATQYVDRVADLALLGALEQRRKAEDFARQSEMPRYL